MFTKEERLFIWKKVYEMIDRLEDGEYICVALRNVVFMYFKTHKNIYEFRSDEMVRIYFPELEEKISMATEPEETRTFYGWFGCLSPETKEVRLNIVKDIRWLYTTLHQKRKIVHIYTEIRTGFHQNPLPSGNIVTSKDSFADFLMMLKAPLISALIVLPEEVLNNPRLVLLPL